MVRSGNNSDGLKGLDLIVPSFAMMYAVWTVYVHAATVTHASFNMLMRWLPPVIITGIFVTFLWLRLARHTHSESSAFGSTSSGQFASTGRLLALPAACLWVTALFLGVSYNIFWWGAVISLSIIWISTVRLETRFVELQSVSRRTFLTVIAVAAAAMLITMVANRPDMDDAFYLSVPATLLRFPQQPVLLHDTIYRFSDLPIQLPVYRVHSYEVWIGALARTLNTSPAVIAYLVLPPVFAALSVISWFQLLRLLVPERPGLALACLFLCVLMLGEAHHSYGNFAFVRMFQGKAILATFVIPCVVFFALEYSRTETTFSWIGLFCAQIAAIGITSSALFVAPIAAAIALASTWKPDLPSTRRLFLGILASVYVLGVAAVLFFATHGGRGFVTSVAMPPLLPLLIQTFGWWSAAVILAVLLACWASAKHVSQKRMFAASSLCFFLSVLNPYTYRFIADHVTGTSTYWRLCWALPIPFMLAIVLTDLLTQAMRMKSNILAAATFSSLGVGVLACLVHMGTLRKDNSVTLGLPSLKLNATDYSIAKDLARSTPEKGALLAPESIASIIPTFVVHPQLISARGMYLVGAFGKREGSRRLDLQLYVSGTARSPNAPSEFDAALTHDSIMAVVVTHSAPWRQEISAMLRVQGWHCEARGTYDIWTENSVSVLTH